MRSRTVFATLVLSILLSLTTALPAAADGIIIVDPPPLPPAPEPVWLTIKRHRVTVTIKDQVATTRVDQVFVNESRWELEGTYIFPLPADASVQDFAMWVDGRRVEGKVLDADQARRIYEEIVRRRRDPALLEYLGRGAFQVRIFPIPPGEERRIELEYSQVLPIEDGLVRYVYPLDPERFSARPLESVSINVSIESDVPIKAVYSSSHRVAVDRPDDYHATVGYEAQDVLPDRDFVLYYTVSPEEVGANLLSFREGEEDGFFLLLVAPRVAVEQEAVVARDVLLVLDTSGSMEGEKLDQAKAALRYVLEHLNPEDRFNITDFSTGVRTFARSPQPLKEREAALRWVDGLQAVGGTDINRALLETLAGVDPTRPTVLLFLTDGLPTSGVVEVPEILNNVTQALPPNVRVFTFGVGDDVNTVLLDTLAREHGGASLYVRPGERIDEVVSGLYAKISTPVLTDLRLEVEGVQVEDLYPYPLPDLFAGSQLIVVGRYREGGTARLRLTGRVDDRLQAFTYEGLTFRRQGGDPAIPRLWATRKIGYLLDQIRLHGESRELVDEIVALSVRYGIVTPYTSYLVEEPTEVLTEEGRRQAAEEMLSQLPAATAEAVGAPAVEKAAEVGGMREAEVPMEVPTGMPGEAGPEAAPVRVVGPKTFVLREGVWTDTTFDPARMQPRRVGFGSEDYFRLLEARPDLGAYFALGRRVIVVVGETAYQVVEGEGEPIELPTPLPATPEAGPTAQVGNPSSTPAPSTEPMAEKTGLCLGALLLGLMLGVVGWSLVRSP